MLNSKLIPGYMESVRHKPVDKFQSHRWDFEYGVYSAHATHLDRTELLNDISEKLAEITNTDITSIFDIHNLIGSANSSLFFICACYRIIG